MARRPLRRGGWLGANELVRDAKQRGDGCVRLTVCVKLHLHCEANGKRPRTQRHRSTASQPRRRPLWWLAARAAARAATRAAARGVVAMSYAIQLRVCNANVKANTAGRNAAEVSASHPRLASTPRPLWWLTGSRAAGLVIKRRRVLHWTLRQCFW